MPDCLLETEAGASRTEGRRLPEMPDGRRDMVEGEEEKEEVVVGGKEGEWGSVGAGVEDGDDKMEEIYMRGRGGTRLAYRNATKANQTKAAKLEKSSSE